MTIDLGKPARQRAERSAPRHSSTGHTIQVQLGELASGPGSSAEATLRSPSRRTVLFGGLGLAAAVAAGYELVQDGALPGKYRLAQLDGACGSAPPPPAGRRPTRHARTFESAYRHTAVQMITLVPPDATAGSDLGVVLALHGAGNTAAGLANQVASAMTAAKIATFAVVCVDGGNTYWHKRADGDDPIGMILHEVLPRVAATGLASRRIGILGESMGGYGALLLAERLSAAAGTTQSLTTSGAARPPAPASTVAAVAAMSPAIFATFADARSADSGAFDSQADFTRNDVFAGISALRHVPSWLACGADDPFQPEAALFRARLAALTRHQMPGGIVGGCHDDAFWQRNMPAALQFIGGHLG